MLNSFTGIEIGKRSLNAHNQALTTIGHNISNASVKGYSRQRVEMKAFDPLYIPGLNREETAGQIGQGVEVERIERLKDMLLEGRIVKETSIRGYWQERDKNLLMLEQVYNEPTELSVRSMMDKFWTSWEDLSLNPTQNASRRAVLERGETLMDAISARFHKLKDIRDVLEGDIKGTATQFNELVREIAGLNEQIVKVEAMGDNPNDLKDRRDLLVLRLSEMADISISEKDPDEFTVYLGGMHVVQGKRYQNMDLRSNPDNEGYSDVIWEGSDDVVWFRGGKLGALVELRDEDTRDEILKLDLMAINFVDLVNEVHKKGYGINKETGKNFFVEYPFVNNLSGNYDRNGDGAYDSSYVFRLTGNNRLTPREQIGIAGTITLSGSPGNVNIDYFPTDTVEDLIERINLSGAEVVARLNLDGILSLKAIPSADIRNPDFVIRHVEDSGQFLVGYTGLLPQEGPAGAYDWGGADAVDGLVAASDWAVSPLAHPSGWIGINPELKEDPGGIATSLEAPFNGPGDGSAALTIANLRTEPVMIGRISTFDNYFADAVAEIGLKGEQAETAIQTEDLIIKELMDMRDSISGVNMDEELANMVKFQHGYSAAARFVSEVDKMLDLIINRMGV